MSTRTRYTIRYTAKSSPWPDEDPSVIEILDGGSGEPASAKDAVVSALLPLFQVQVVTTEVDVTESTWQTQ